MASSAGYKQQGSSRGSSSSPPAWTQRQNKQFECALAVYDRDDAPDRWHNVSRYMGGSKSADEVRRHFQRLVDDVAQIESSRVPFPRYPAPPAQRAASTSSSTRDPST